MSPTRTLRNLYRRARLGGGPPAAYGTAPAPAWMFTDCWSTQPTDEQGVMYGLALDFDRFGNQSIVWLDDDQQLIEWEPVAATTTFPADAFDMTCCCDDCEFPFGPDGG